MPAVNDVGEPCAGEPHARFDGRELETEQVPAMDTEKNGGRGKPPGHSGSATYCQELPPRQLPTLQWLVVQGAFFVISVFLQQVRGFP
jgi:hypothetical protein